ncbi:MAG TPA: SpoIIE family protein phosphatase [Vicinamibacterales bacterium]|nr:SpoIIE family protein phosphatase [Vicinamibacterales bacterium]
MFLRSWPGRLFIVSLAVKLLVALLRVFGDLPAFVEVLSSTATIGLIVALLYFGSRLFVLVKTRLLWRVRRKLILSYIFIGVVPALLIAGFFLLAASVASMNVSAYLFKDSYDDVVQDATVLAEAAAREIGRSPQTTGDTLRRLQENAARSRNYPSLSLVFVPQPGLGSAVRAGAWDHAPAPETVPAWVQERTAGFAGTVVMEKNNGTGRLELVVRAVRRTTSGPRTLGFAVADVPIDGALIDQLHESSGVKAGPVEISGDRSRPDLVGAMGGPPGDESRQFSLFGRSVAFFDAYDWQTGDVRRATVSMTYRVSELYQRLSRAQAAQLTSTVTVAEGVLLLLIFFAVLFLIIWLAALVMGLALARSMTSSIHELFMGTERVRQGDFTHRIDIRTKDQLGELAGSFNQMTGSIENLLQTAAEKKRLDEELRIARQIQMSLLPRGPVGIPGLSVTALCVPAREVGGDYYDFFPLGPQRVGVLIADVSGKGTSAALYMAVLKGIVLSLSQIYQSPRQLLLEVNRIISDNLDSRSFITVTYAVIDLAARHMTYARAGHTPLIYVPGPAAGNRGAQVLTPNGLVLGLRIDGAAEKFAELLEEQRVPLHQGDILVFYTDGITEAMNARSDLFGESRLSRIVEDHSHLESGELRERILREIEAFVGSADQHDDMTMILIKVERPEAARVAV